MLQVQNLKKMIEQIRKTATKDTLKQLQQKSLVLIRKVSKEIKT